MANGIVPRRQQDAINFFSSRLTLWAANAANIGLSASNVSAIANAVNAAQTALAASEAAHNTARSATVTLDNNMTALRSLGGDLVKTIRTYAETTGNPNVYALSNLPPPAKPSPLGPPQPPADLLSQLDTTGAVRLTWKASRRGGTSFTIERRTATPGATPGPWSLIGSSEERSFLDADVPTGLASATYRVTAHRSGGSSTPSDVTTVYFGSGGQSSGDGLALAA
ncbi:MAG: hypothetical protein KJZ65_00340 [Phycisphaerales bacterium]|nr:hypothetical protein [Phycisphaerales bacterium]